MSFLKKSVSFMAVFAVLPAAFAVTTSGTPTARPSIITQATTRMPTMATQYSLGNIISSSGSSSSSATMADKECIDSYTECAKGADVCGPNFEECTNKTLFYAKKAACTSTLMQCNTSGVNSLFGTSNQTAFSNKDSNGEYTYPTNGSVLGQLIEAAQINNRYDTSSCVRRYTTCLKKDDVCGADFELCTSNNEFKNQKLFCESTLARCQADGIRELFGSTNTSSNPSADSRLGSMISEGAALAAVNSVATCYKVVDQCILNACSTNPYKCKEGSNQDVVSIVEVVNSGNPIVATHTGNSLGVIIGRSEINGFIKNACLDTIGSNKFCYATFMGNGAMPTNAQIRDEDNKSDIFAEAYSSRMNESMRTKIDDLVERFDKKTKQRCQDTIVQCAMRSCGEGSGAACYASAFSNDLPTNQKGVTSKNTLPSIKYGCEAVINNDTSCKYASSTFSASTGILNFLDSSLFDTLFTAPNDTDVSKPDPVGAVAALNAKLASTYTQAGLDQMRRQCQTIAAGCVRSMCGADFINCYRNRTDVFTDITSTGNAAYDRSMNKVGGVLDYTIVIGLCLDTVKNNNTCTEHIKTESARRNASPFGATSTANSWGSAGTTRDGWIDAGGASAVSADYIHDTDENGNSMCYDASGETGPCGSGHMVAGTYMIFLDDKPVTTSRAEYTLRATTNTVFRELIRDLETEAQARYNAKLTKEQNMCLAGNSGGGIVGARDNGSTFMWVKLTGNGKVSSNYVTGGLTSNQFVASNDLYGSFCRIRVTLQSDNKTVQDTMAQGQNSWGTAYYAVGDSFTCGSWIPNEAIEKMSESAVTLTDAQRRNRNWMTLLGVVGGGVGGGVGMNALQKGGLGGLLGTNNSSGKAKNQSTFCVANAEAYKNSTSAIAAEGYATAAIEAAQKIGGAMATANYSGIQDAVTNATTVESNNGISNANNSTNNANNNSQNQSNSNIEDLIASITKAQKAYDDAQDAVTKAGSGATPEQKNDVVLKRMALEHAQGVLRSAQSANAATADTRNRQVREAKAAANAGMDRLITMCKEGPNMQSDGNGRVIGNLVGVGLGGVIGGVLAAQATKTVQMNELERDQREWMENIGQHIRCYIGSNEVGSFGDIISTELEQ